METSKANKRKRCFSDSWLTDDRFKLWLRKVPSDDSLYYCTVCDKNFSCNTNLLKHTTSACHKNTSSCDNINISSSLNIPEKKKFKQQVRQQWFDIKELKPWLREVAHDKNLVFCCICEKNITAHLSSIYRHANSAMHTHNCNIKNIVNTCDVNDDDDDDDETFVTFDEQKKSAEIEYSLLIADKNISLDTAQSILNFFKKVGKNSKVLESMNISRKKCTKIISNVLCPVETDRIVKNIQNTKFSVFIDETSDISNEKWMTFFVRYVNSKTLDVYSQLVKLINVDAKDCNSEKLFHAFKIEMWKLQIPFSNVIALSCDNASVMTGKHLSFKKRLEEMSKNLLTFPCPCHSVALAANVACYKISDFCEKLLKKVPTYINSSPKRFSIFREFSEYFQESSHKILKLSNTRWLSRYSCVERILSSWDSIKHFLIDMAVIEKNEMGEDLLSIMQNIDTKAYLLFLKYILNLFNTFNAFFQAVETRIHLLHSKSMNLLFQISQHFLKPDLLKDLFTINFSESTNHKSLEDINLGSECEEYLNEVSKENIDAITNIRNNCLEFLITAAEEIHKRLPIADRFLSKLKVFQSQSALFDVDRETSFKDVCFIIKTIGGFDEDELKKEWSTLHLNFSDSEKLNLSKLSFDEMWKQILQCQTKLVKYPNLTLLLNAIRSLPNSNADSERIFSLLTDIKTKKRNLLSSSTINGICVLKSALKTRGESISNIKISKKHLSLMSSDILYASSDKKRSKSLNQLYAV